MSGESPHHPTLATALQAIRETYVQVLRTSPVQELRATEDQLRAGLASRFTLEEDGSIVLQDGSRLHVGPERGDRGEETGRIGVVQQFPDDQPDRVHLVAPERSPPGGDGAGATGLSR